MLDYLSVHLGLYYYYFFFSIVKNVSAQNSSSQSAWSFMNQANWKHQQLVRIKAGEKYLHTKWPRKCLQVQELSFICQVIPFKCDFSLPSFLAKSHRCALHHHLQESSVFFFIKMKGNAENYYMHNILPLSHFRNVRIMRFSLYYFLLLFFVALCRKKK